VPRVGARRGNVIEIAIVFVVLVAVSVGSMAFQKQITLAEGRGWDGEEYYDVAVQFATGQPIVGVQQHTFRLGTPFLAALLARDDLILGFRLANLVAAVVAVALLVVWLRLFVARWQVRTLLTILFITQWHAPVRYVHFYPVYIDPWATVFLIAGLIGIHKLATRAAPEGLAIAALDVISFLGVIFRETTLAIPVAALFARNFFYYDLKRSVLYAMPLVSGLAAFALTHLIAKQTSNYAVLPEAVTWAYNKPLPTFIHAWFIAFGPILALLAFGWRLVARVLTSYPYLIVYLIAIALFAYLGGDDHERYVYYAMPVVYALIGIVLEGSTRALLLASPALVAVLTVAQAISQRVMWTTPDVPNPYPHTFQALTSVGSEFPYLDLLSMHGPRELEQDSLVQYLVLTAVILVWLALIKKIGILKSRQGAGRRRRVLLSVAQGLVSLGLIAGTASAWAAENLDYLKPRTTLVERHRWALATQLQEPRGIAYLDGKIYVAAREPAGRGHVGKFDLSTGDYKIVQPMSDGRPVDYAHPTDVKVGPDGLLYVLENGEKAENVLVMGPDGRVIRQIAIDAIAPAGMGLALAPDGELYVTNLVQGDISKYASTGGARLGSYGGNGGPLNNPTGIEIDKDGMIYVADNSQRVQQLDLSGRFVREYHVRSLPQYIAVNGDWVEATGDPVGVVSINKRQGYVQLCHFVEPAPRPAGTPAGLAYGAGNTLYVLYGNTLIEYEVRH
jgi:hypothetical protein